MIYAGWESSSSLQLTALRAVADLQGCSQAPLTPDLRDSLRAGMFEALLARAAFTRAPR